MKKFILIFWLFSSVMFLPGLGQEKNPPVNVSADLVSSFVWRGTRLGTGPAIQPTIELNTGGFTLGTWGSYYFSDAQSSETDLYASFSFDFGLSLGVTDYYFPAFRFYNVKNHAFELNAGFEKANFSFSANYFLNEGAGTEGGDLYFEAGYTAGNVSLFAGAGNGWHTPDGKFAVCNTGVSVVKEIKITDTFSIPLTGSLIFNPYMERLYLVAGITL